MINRIKFLAVLFLSVLGLSGCIVVDDEVPVYSTYPAGSYGSAIDYYHRPPRPYASHHKFNASIHKKGHHLDKPKQIKKPEPPKKEHKPQIKKPEPPKKEHKPQIKKPEHSVKQKAHEIPQHHAPKQEKITKPEPKSPIEEKLHKEKILNHSNLKKEHLKKPKIHVHK